MKVIERLNTDHAEKLRYFLSKADTVPNERDRQKVVVQITQNLSSRLGAGVGAGLGVDPTPNPDPKPNRLETLPLTLTLSLTVSSRVRNAHAFELPSLYIPSFAEEQGGKARAASTTTQRQPPPKPYPQPQP